MPDAHTRNVLRDFAKRARDLPALSKLDAAAVEAFDAFAAAGVDALLLKGPALARMLYTAGEHRGYSDVDLLVAPRDLSKARLALGDLGYTNTRDRLGIDDRAGAMHAETWAGGGHNAASGLEIDLHWQLAGSEAPPQAAWEALRRRRAWLELEGRRVPTLNPEGLAMHLATHAAQHGTRYPKPIEDLGKGLERWTPEVWRQAERLAREIEATAAFAAGLRLMPAGAALAHDLGLPATDELQWTIAHRNARPRGTFHLQSFARARTRAERASVLRRSLFPKREWIAWQHPWARAGGVRLIVAYGLHLMRLPAWAVAAWWFQRRARRAR